MQPRATASPARKPVPVLPPVEPDSDHEDNIPTDHIEVVLPEGLPTDPEADIHVEFNEDDENDPELLVTIILSRGLR